MNSSMLCWRHWYSSPSSLQRRVAYAGELWSQGQSGAPDGRYVCGATGAQAGSLLEQRAALLPGRAHLQTYQGHATCHSMSRTTSLAPWLPLQR